MVEMVRAVLAQEVDDEVAKIREGVGAEQREPVSGAPTPPILSAASARQARRLGDVEVGDDPVANLYLN